MAQESTDVAELLSLFHKLHRVKERVRKEALMINFDLPAASDAKALAAVKSAGEHFEKIRRCLRDIMSPVSLYSEMCQATYNIIQHCDDIYQIASRSNHAGIMRLAETVSLRTDAIAELVFEAADWQ
jgi:hypothetical protein